MNGKIFNRPLFIFGMARSGTTYLRRLVNSLPGVFLLYESKIIWTAYNIFQKEDVLTNRAIFQRFLERLKACERQSSDLFTQPLEFYDHLYKNFCKHRDLGEFFKELFSSSIGHGKIWGNKLLQKEELKVLFKIFPHARFIIIIRDVRSVVYSAHLFNKDNIFTASLLWSDNARFIKSIKKESTNLDMMFLRYEDFVRDSNLVLKQIASFIGAETPEDFSIAATAHTKSIDKWRNHLTSKEVRQIEEICFNEMKHFGYKPEFAEGSRKMSLLRFIISIVLQMRGRLIKQKGGLRGIFSYKSLYRYLKAFWK
jgi:hypothetical protein